jgi:NodT family efflux transporter outer membrane factor (OMF) lipoprotein
MLKRLILISISFAFISCVSAPKTKKIAVGVLPQKQWTGSETRAGQIDSLWWQSFGDTDLDTIVNEALTKNFNLKTAFANLDAAIAQAKITGASLYPQLSASMSASRRKQNFIGFPIPGAPDQVLSTTVSTFSPSLNLSWELDLWGRVRSGQSAALADVQASQADLAGAQLSLAAQVCRAWFAAIEAKRQVELAKATAESYRVSSEQVQDRYERGLRRSLDVRLSLTNLATAEAVLSQRQALLDNILRQIEILLARYPDASLNLSDDLPRLPGNIPEGLPAGLIARRPDVVAAERHLVASDARIRQAKAALYPQISLTGSAGTSTKELGDILNGDFGVWSLVGNLLQPLFQGGRLRANVDLAKSQSSLALAQYGQTVLNAFREVETSLANERFLSERQQALETATRQSIAARRLAEEQYANGIIGLITMLDAQRSAFNSESQLLTVRRERLDARIDLYLALGGGFLQ